MVLIMVLSWMEDSSRREDIREVSVTMLWRLLLWTGCRVCLRGEPRRSDSEHEAE